MSSSSGEINWLIKQGDGHAGPYSTEQVRALVAAGSISRATLVRQETGGAWLRAGQVPAFFSKEKISGASAAGATNPPTVFVCHSSKDQSVANSIAEMLEQNGLQCWIAPRDIPGGAQWTSMILEAIGKCRVMVVVYSESANTSPHVLREVERGLHNGLAILPVRLENVKMRAELEYLLSAIQWLEVPRGRYKDCFHELLQRARDMHALDGIPIPQPKKKPFPWRKFRFAAAIGMMIIGLGAIAYISTIDDGTNPPSTPPNDVREQSRKVVVDQIVQGIKAQVEPEGWMGAGGVCTITTVNDTITVSAPQSVIYKTHEYLNGIRQSRGLPTLNLVIYGLSERESYIERALKAEVSDVDFVSTPLSQVCAQLADEFAIPIQLDFAEIDLVGIDPDTLITLVAPPTSLGSVLDLMLSPQELTYVLNSDMLLITSRDAEQLSYMVAQPFDLSDLVASFEKSTASSDAVGP